MVFAFDNFFFVTGNVFFFFSDTLQKFLQKIIKKRKEKTSNNLVR